MAKTEPTDWENWRQREHPWDSGRPLTQEDHDEIGVFMHQGSFEKDRETRRKAFEEKQGQERQAFEIKQFLDRYAFREQELSRDEDLMYPFAHKLWYRGIDEIRSQIAPAYTFSRISNLPKELQLRVWYFASCAGSPQISSITRDCEDIEVSSSEDNESEDDNWMATRSSRIYWESPQFSAARVILGVLHACRDARKEAQKVYSRMPYKSYESRYHRNSWPGYPPPEAYFNTLYNTFYMAGGHWQEFKVLADILMGLNPTRQLRPGIQAGVRNLQEIRLLAVDFNIFAEAPIRLWLEFPKLEKLTIILYPSDEIEDPDDLEPDSHIDFVKAKQGSLHGKRCDWVTASAIKSLQACKTAEVPNWKMPEVNTLVRLIGTYEDDDVELEEDDETGSKPHIVNGDHEDEEDEDDIEWYQQVETKLSKRESKECLILQWTIFIEAQTPHKFVDWYTDD